MHHPMDSGVWPCDVGEPNENLEIFLPANLMKRGLLQLCHFSTQFPLH
jgi:hypothetical protein